MLMELLVPTQLLMLQMELQLVDQKVEDLEIDQVAQLVVLVEL